jgi:hypothetical protein
MDGEVHPSVDQQRELVKAPACQAALAAIRIRGDGLQPAYADGDVIFYASAAGALLADSIGRDCVVQLAGGPMLLKRVSKGARRDRYTLTSHVTPPIDDVELAWASPVRWVRRG